MIKINADEAHFPETPIFDGMDEELPTVDSVPRPGVLPDEDLVTEFFADRLKDGWPVAGDFTLPRYEPLSYEDPEHVEEKADGDYEKSQEVFVQAPAGPEDTARWSPVFEDEDA